MSAGEGAEREGADIAPVKTGEKLAETGPLIVGDRTGAGEETEPSDGDKRSTTAAGAAMESPRKTAASGTTKRLTPSVCRGDGATAGVGGPNSPRTAVEILVFDKINPQKQRLSA
jgi:hypothetical protein